MSSPNRNKFLIGFGVVAVVVIATVAFWPPAFLNDDASGAIGAVQKHNVPQITQADVILGSEQAKTQNAVLYNDYFTDSTKLQNLSSALLSKEAGSKFASNSMEFANELENQFANRYNSALAAIQLEAQQQGDAEFAQKAGALQAQLNNNQELNGKMMNQLASMFANLAAAKTASKSGFQIASQQLDSALANTEMASANLASANHELSSLELFDVSLANQAEYFSNIAAAYEVLSKSNLRSEEAASKVASATELASAANRLQSAALSNIEEQTASNIQAASAIQQMQSQLAAAKEAGNMAAYSKDISQLQNSLASATSLFQSYAASSIQLQVAALNNVVASHEQFQNMAANHVQASMVANTEAANKVYSMLSNSGELQSCLNNLASALHNADLANVLANEEQLSSSLANLQSQLQSHSN